MNRKLVILVVVAAVVVAGGVGGYLFFLGPGGPRVSVSLESVSVASDGVVATFTIRNPTDSPIFVETFFSWMVNGDVWAVSPIYLFTNPESPIQYEGNLPYGFCFEIAPGQSESFDLTYPVIYSVEGGLRSLGPGSGVDDLPGFVNHSSRERLTPGEVRNLPSMWRPQGIATFNIGGCETIYEGARSVNLLCAVIEGSQEPCTCFSERGFVGYECGGPLEVRETGG